MINLFSLFSGIGAPEKALDRLGIEYKLVGFSEIDKCAVKSYCAIHNVDESLNYGDITKIDETKLPKDIDLIFYGFPCQDISLAGKQKGLFNEDGSQTRSGLFFDALRIIEATQPRVAIAENVRNLTGNTFKEEFEIVLNSLKQAGYNNYWKVLNAKNFGVPQNRERVFIVSIRKDIDNGAFEFPLGFPLTKKLKHILEDEVDEKFFYDKEAISNIVNFKNDVIEVKQATKKGYAEAVEGDSVNFEQPNSKTRRGRVGKQVAQTLTTSPQQGVVLMNSKAVVQKVGRINSSQDGVVVSVEGISPTHTAGHGNTPKILCGLRIRKLTPKECWRLMKFDDEDFEKARHRMNEQCYKGKDKSSSQLYKQAGNSIVVPVLEHIFRKLIESGVLIPLEKTNIDQIDLIELRKQIKQGIFKPYVKGNKVYLKDAENGETIMICEVKEVGRWQRGSY